MPQDWLHLFAYSLIKPALTGHSTKPLILSAVSFWLLLLSMDTEDKISDGGESIESKLRFSIPQAIRFLVDKFFCFFWIFMFYTLIQKIRNLKPATPAIWLVSSHNPIGNIHIRSRVIPRDEKPFLVKFDQFNS